MVPQVAKKLPPLEEFKELLSQHKVLALTEGSVDAPSSPSSTELVNLLKSQGIKFVAVDVIQRQDLIEAI